MTRRQSLFLASCSRCFRHTLATVRSMGFWATRTSPQRLFPLERVFDTADSILDLSCCLVGLALGLQLSITKHLAGNLLGFTFDLLRRSLDPVLVHDFFLQDLAKPLNGRDGYGVAQLFLRSQNSGSRRPSSNLINIAHGAI